MSPMETEVRTVASEHGWDLCQVDPHVCRVHRGQTSVTVAFTYGGHLRLQTVHVESPDASWWLRHSDRHKKEILLDLLRGT